MTWGDLFLDIVQKPQRYLFWVIIFLILLFALSRLNNYLEVTGVDKAIYITRATVGSFMYFIVAPIILFLMINVIALIYGIKTIDIGFLFKWIGLTLSSYWWLLKCGFGSSDISGQADLYTIDAVIRILWILIPLSFIWLRMSSTNVGKLFILPIIIGVLVITRHKKAEPTFITEDLHDNITVIRKIPVLNWFVDDPMESKRNEEGSMSPRKRKLIAGSLVLLIVIGVVVALYLQYRVAGLLVIILGLLGFLLMTPNTRVPDLPDHVEEEHYHADIDSLITKMDSIYRFIGADDIKVYQLSLEIEAAYHAKEIVGVEVLFPDSLCMKYGDYFYDRCHELKK